VIEARKQIVWRSTAAGRNYLTKRAAIHAEARALIKRKHPSESAEWDVGFAGWRWEELPRSDVLWRRVVRLVKRANWPEIEL
jgi:hypothetical protein